MNNPKLPGDTHWEEKDLGRWSTRPRQYGLTFEAIENVPTHFYDKAMLGLPGRDEQIENYQTTLRNVGRAGMPILGFHFMPNSVWRTERLAPGRGGAGCTKFDMAAIDGQDQAPSCASSCRRRSAPVSMPIFDEKDGDRDGGADVGRTTPTSSRRCCRSPRRPA